MASGDTAHQRLHSPEGDQTRETTLQSIIHTKSFSSVYLEGRKHFCSISFSTSTTNNSSSVALSFHGDKVSLDAHDAHMPYTSVVATGPLYYNSHGVLLLIHVASLS